MDHALQNSGQRPQIHPDAAVPRGHLKIFFGYATGVGKTCAMLQAAHAARRKGVDVLAGCVEPHGRAGTLALLDGLEQLPPLGRSAKGAGEFDLDAALQRRPQLILLDELAHINAAGLRHSRRFQDVEELIKAGIDVYTTANVQHIESLTDTVFAITGESVRSRIPDRIFDQADQVELVDIEPSELIERLNAGEIFRDPEARQAAEKRFTVENLTALREVALRRCADRVNLITEEARHRGQSGPRTGEHILVCLSSAPSNPRIIRTAARMSYAFHSRFTALFVQTPLFAKMSGEDRARLRDNTRLAQQLGANIETVYGNDIPLQIAEFARLSGVSRIVLGRSAAAHRRSLLNRSSLTDRLIAAAPDMDIHIIPDGDAGKGYSSQRTQQRRRAPSLREAGISVALLILTTILNGVFYRLGLSESNLIMVYLLGVLLTAIATRHRVCSLFSAVTSVFLYNYLFTVPRFTFRVYDSNHLVTFVIMFLLAYIASTLALRLKDHAYQSSQAAHRTKILFDTDQLLNRARGRAEIIHALAGQLVKLLGRAVVVYPVEARGLMEPEVYPADDPAEEDILCESERNVALWVMKNNKHAGATTDSFSDAKCLYLALRVNDSVYGVVGIAAKQRPLDAFEHSVLLSILGEGALALENEKNAREKEETAILARNEQLRANLLRAISHDLRTPLTSISGNASNLISNSAGFDEETKQRLYTDIYDDAMWLISLVENLLSITRIEEGRMNLRLSAELVDEVIAEALRHLNRKSGEHRIRFNSGDELLLARMDARLIVQVLVNLVDNAIKYTPVGSHIEISTRKEGPWACIRVADDGPGIAPESRDRVFDMFYSGANRVADSRRSLGLGLSLCKSIVNAHGGNIRLLDNPPHGAAFEFTLPAEEVQLHE